MNESQVRERLQVAIGETAYPAYLASRIEARLKPAANRRWRRGVRTNVDRPRLAGIGRPFSLVAALLVVLLMAALVLGVHLLRTGDLNVGPVPAGQGLSVAEYQRLVSTDDDAFQATQVDHCGDITDAGCPAAAQVVITSLQKWLDDLNGVQPPARFATAHALMRRHLMLIIPDHYEILAAFAARDEARFQAALNTSGAQKDLLLMIAGDVVVSRPGTVATYTRLVQLDGDQLAGQTLADCVTTQAAGCAGRVAAVRVIVERLQSDQVAYLAPDSLVAKDKRLAVDLADAGVALDAMDSALSAGDQLALQAGVQSLTLALTRVQTDVAAIRAG